MTPVAIWLSMARLRKPRSPIPATMAIATKTELAVAKVVNRKGFTLPVTGGFGTLLFSGIGVLLVLAGVGVLFSLKKKSNRA